MTNGLKQERPQLFSEVHVVSSFLPMTLTLGEDQHMVDYVMKTDINCSLKVWLEMICSND